MCVASDENLLDRFKETGEISHFDELVGRHIGRVRSMIYPMVLNDADADELTQEVFFRVVNAIDKFRGKARFSTWLYKITLNTTNSFLRKNSRYSFVSDTEIPELLDSENEPKDVLVRKEKGIEVGRAMSALSPKLRSAITLTGINGMSVKEAAKASGCLMSTMYWRVHEARRILKNTLSRGDA